MANLQVVVEAACTFVFTILIHVITGLCLSYTVVNDMRAMLFKGERLASPLSVLMDWRLGQSARVLWHH